MEYFLFLMVFAGFSFWFGLREPLRTRRILLFLGTAVLIAVVVWFYIIARSFSAWAFVVFMFTASTSVVIGGLLALFLKGRRKWSAAVFVLLMPLLLYISMWINEKLG